MRYVILILILSLSSCSFKTCEERGGAIRKVDGMCFWYMQYIGKTPITHYRKCKVNKCFRKDWDE